METIITICYLVFVLGSGLIISYGLVNLWDAHKRGMERVRAYDLQQRANKTNPYLLTTRQEARK